MKKPLFLAIVATLVLANANFAQADTFVPNGRTHAFANMDTQQFCTAWISPEGGGNYLIALNCDNGQQWNAFHYNMRVIFRNQEKILRVEQFDVSLLPRGPGRNSTDSPSRIVYLGDIVDDIQNVLLEGIRF
ncbi:MULTISPECIES: hypothetical protein [unclassified Bradyrhizobium]|uniref:hypothetical protein n=1 Tax=unclassified Bradyrhizobium TaxID=2631580 RepID=UPI002916ED9F|nr:MULTISPECIES: hypothetical protein [unclassified Bradyrhizobium]